MNFASTFFVPPCCSLPFMVTQKCFNAINAHLNVCIVLQIPKFLNNNHSRLTFVYTCKYSKKTIVDVSFEQNKHYKDLKLIQYNVKVCVCTVFLKLELRISIILSIITVFI